MTGPSAPPGPGVQNDPWQQAQAMLLRPLLQSAGLTRALAASPVLEGLFVDTLAQALASQQLVPMGPAAEHAAGEVPVAGATVSSPFGPRADPFHARETFHHGVDLAAPQGTPVQSIWDGKVTAVKSDPEGLGLHVEVAHSDGKTLVYGHLERAGVQPGQTVKGGQVLGEVGHSGRATGPHLHLEMRVLGRPVDPSRVAVLNAYGAVSTSQVSNAPTLGRRTP